MERRLYIEEDADGKAHITPILDHEAYYFWRWSKLGYS